MPSLPQTPLARAVLMALTPIAVGAADALAQGHPPQSIRAEHVLTLGNEDGEGIIPGMVRSVARDQAGQFWVTVHSNEPPVVFDAQGRFRMTVGRRGEGPGEFGGGLQVVATEGDSVLVYDGGNGRMSAFDLDGEFRSSWSLVSPLFWDFAVVSNRWAVMNARIPTRESAGLPIHVFSDERVEPLRSFGVDAPIRTTDAPRGAMNRLLAAGGDGAFWAAARNEVLLERWDVDGRRLARIRRHPEWFVPTIDEADASEGEPYAFLMNVDLDATGRLWISAAVPEDDWLDGTGVSTDRTGQARRRIEDYAQVYDVVVEVVAPDGGEVLARGRFDRPLALFLGDHYMATLQTHRNRVPIVEIWRLRLDDR